MNKKCNIGERKNEIENKIYENLLQWFKNCRNITEICCQRETKEINRKISEIKKKKMRKFT